MRRGLICSGVVTVAVLAGPYLHAAGSGAPALVERFLSIDGPAPTQFRALRHLEAKNDHFDSNAWMEVWTEADQANGFRYEIVGQGGSEYIRKRVFIGTLEAEKKMWAGAMDSDASAFSSTNYQFEDRGLQPDGLASITVKPRRKDMLLVDGTIYLRPEDGELVRVEGRLSKSPSFWTRRVEIVRWFHRFAGIRMPVAIESAASVLIAGHSTFRMTYDYETVNGHRVGNPQPQTLTARAERP
jgi:hypothetical protein